MCGMVPTIFNHSSVGSYPAEMLARMPGVDCYHGRVLGSTTPQDIIQLPPQLKDGLPWITEHYDAIGIDVTRQVVWDDSYGVLARPEYVGYDHSVFVMSDLVHVHRPNTRLLGAVTTLNNKNAFLSACAEMGVPTPRTFFYDDFREVRYDAQTYPLWVKKAESASGMDIWRCRNQAELAQALTALGPGVQFQIQANCEGIFLNVGFEITAQGEFLQGPVTEQIIEDMTVHSGNLSIDSRLDAAKIRRLVSPEQFHPVLDYMRKLGMLGKFAFDVNYDPTSGVARIIECNARFNGAHYPWRMWQRLREAHGDMAGAIWRARNVGGVTVNDLGALDLDEDVFKPETGEGIVIVNWGCIYAGKLGILSVGHSTDAVCGLEDRFLDRFT